MDMTTLKSGNGYITTGEILLRLHRFRPPDGDHYHFRKLDNSDFAEVGVMCPRHAPAMLKLFKVYAGNEELYDYIRQLFLEAAKSLGRTAQVEDWRAT